MRKRVSKENLIWLAVSKGFKASTSGRETMTFVSGKYELVVNKNNGCQLRDYLTGDFENIHTKIFTMANLLELSL